VDGQVLINKGHGAVGDILPVLIKEAHPYDLVGEIIELSLDRHSRNGRKRVRLDQEGFENDE
ncbi:MAG: hypothetical protein MUO52_15920, partial [Desulfobacterales bacterium]|nr:hypothetical protein [Desulfobacterales bacterium]